MQPRSFYIIVIISFTAVLCVLFILTLTYALHRRILLQNGYQESNGQLKPAITNAYSAQRSTLRWLAVNAKIHCSSNKFNFLAEQKKLSLSIFASAPVSVRMQRAHRTSMKLTMTNDGDDIYHETPHEMRIPERDVTYIVLSVYLLTLIHR